MNFMTKGASKKKKDVEQKGKVRLVIMGFIRLLLIVAFIGALYNGRKLVLFISALAFVLTFLPLILKKLFDVEVPAHFEIIVILFIYGTLFFGEVKGFYTEFWWWSVLLNLASASALGFVGLAVMYSLHKGDKIHASPLMIAFFSFCFAVAIGTVWEFFEFFVDRLFGFDLYNSGDTLGDLAVNVLGSFLVSSAGYYYLKNGRVIIISKLVSRFVERNPKIFGNNADDYSDKIINIIKEGEGEKVEFKSTLRTNLHTNQPDKKMEHSVLKTLTGYLNSDGGTLLIGVSDTGEIIGIEKDSFPSKDKANLHLNNMIKNHIGGEYLPFIKSKVTNIDGKTLIMVECDKSHKEVFLKTPEGEKFYVRNGVSSVELSGSSLVDYVHHTFRKNNN